MAKTAKSPKINPIITQRIQREVANKGMGRSLPRAIRQSTPKPKKQSKPSRARVSTPRINPIISNQMRKSGGIGRSQYVKEGTTGNSQSLAKRPSRANNTAKKTRHRSASGSAARGIVAGRHTPSNFRYKTGYWRPVRQSWMTNEVWEAFKAINRFRHKAMSKGMKAASLGKPIYGKEGPGHAGYGTGHLQHWADKILRQGDGSDPHFVDLVKWFKGAAAAFDYHNGEKDFKALEKAQRGDPDHFMRRVIETLKNSIPELKKLSKRGVNDLIRNKFYTVQYGPDGRAK